mmetsp:Transcript_24077/g.83587  ORF Transcript_24077/g.83587 Transcript_24077/m.83587 type:complete len:271 (-) Transcript_24077:160-972(-)
MAVAVRARGRWALAAVVAALAAMLTASPAAATARVYGAFAVPRQRTAYKYEIVYGPVYNADSSDMAWTLINKMCGSVAGCNFHNVTAYSSPTWMAVVSNATGAFMAHATTEAAAVTKAMRQCSGFCQPRAWTSEMSEHPWPYGRALFQTLAAPMDDADAGARGNVAMPTPGLGGHADVSDAFDSAIVACEAAAGTRCFVRSYVTAHVPGHECASGVGCVVAGGTGDWRMWFAYAGTSASSHNLAAHACGLAEACRDGPTSCKLQNTSCAY